VSRIVWFCSSCHALGVYVYKTGSGAYDVIVSIREAHRGAGPGCTKQEPRIINIEEFESSTVLMSGVGEW
jgi:hypothetical protein